MRRASAGKAVRTGPDAPPASDALTGYRARKLELAELIRAGMNLAGERRDEERKRDARELLARLAEDRFQLAVVGQFSRGKSTLMNAILGAAYLPTGALPMTSVVTSVRYGSTPRVAIRRRGTALPIETSLEDLVRFVAQASGEREELRVASADVEIPAEILRLGFFFVDTPGIGSAIAANTATTTSFLPEADAVIFVTSFDAALGEPELDFLAEVRRHVEKLFFVVNKLDLVDRGEADDILRFVGDRLGEQVDDATRRLFAVSARDALEAKQTGSVERLTASGLPGLEQALVRFLTREKSRSFLLSVCGRAERLQAQQKLELEIGRGDPSQSARERGERRQRFEDGCVELLSQERQVAVRLHDRMATELPGILRERSRAWSEQLQTLVVAEVQDRSSAPPREWLRETSSHLREAVPGLLEERRRRRVAETHSLVVGLAAERIAEMHALRGSIARIGAQAFGVCAPAVDGQPTWSPDDLPQLGSEAVAVTLALDVPWWSSNLPGSRLKSEPRRRLLESLERSVTTYCDDVSAALQRGARRWVDDVAAQVEADTRTAANRIRAALETPASDAQVAALADIERGLTAFRAAVAAWDATTQGPTQAPMAMAVGTPSHLATACVICERLAGVPFDYMAHAQFELARRTERRAEHVRAGGFCPIHTWQYAETASDVGIALAYAQLAHTAAELLSSPARIEDTPDGPAAAVAQLMPGPGRCPACRALADVERDAVAQVVAGLPAHTDGRQAPSLCVRHLAAVLADDPRHDRSRWLAQRLVDTLRRASEDMRTYSLKREALRGQLLSAEERAACLSVIRFLVGSREPARPWRTDDEL